MNLYICGSNRKHNSYNFLKRIKGENDTLISLDELNIKNCLGCMKILKRKLMNNFGVKYVKPWRNIFWRWNIRFNPYCASEKLKGKKIMLLTVGQMGEEDQKEVVDTLDSYFKGITEFLYFDFEYLYNFSSGDIIDVDDINKTYDQEKLDEIIENIKKKINE